jgi:hypothetical protein
MNKTDSKGCPQNFTCEDKPSAPGGHDGGGYGVRPDNGHLPPSQSTYRRTGCSRASRATEAGAASAAGESGTPGEPPIRWDVQQSMPESGEPEQLLRSHAGLLSGHLHQLLRMFDLHQGSDLCTDRTSPLLRVQG